MERGGGPVRGQAWAQKGSWLAQEAYLLAGPRTDSGATTAVTPSLTLPQGSALSRSPRSLPCSCLCWINLYRPLMGR